MLMIVDKNMAAEFESATITTTTTSSQSSNFSNNGSSGKEMPKHSSGLFAITLRHTNGNLKLRCLICQTELWHNSAKTHISKYHNHRLLEYEQNMKTKKGTMDAFAMKGPKLSDPYEGTLENLEQKIARCIVGKRLPLSFTDDPLFNDLIKTAINYGVKASNSDIEKFKTPSRRILVDDKIEGEDGLLKEMVTEAVTRLEPSCEKVGAALIFDGAKDANGKSLEVFMIQSGPHQALVWDGYPSGEGKDTDWMKANLKGLLHGEMDFEKMSVLDDKSLSVPGNDIDDRTKRQKLTANSHLKNLFKLMPHVFALGGDNASTPVRAVRELEKEIATIPFGCAGHAFSRSFQHLCNIDEIEVNVIKKLELISDLFLSRSHLREALRSECEKSVYRIIPTRFVSAAGVAERVVDLKKDLIRVVDSKRFDEYRSAANAELKAQCDQVKSILHDDRFWTWLNFFLKLSTGYVVAVRLLDGAKAGSACLVYKLWSMLSGTIDAAFLEEKDRTISSKTLYEKVIAIILKDWKKFHYPVYSAAYILAPHFHAEIKEMKKTDPEALKELIDDTVHCCSVFYRRFDIQGNPRPTLLAEDNKELLELKIEVMGQIEAYLSLEGQFKADKFSDAELRRSPSAWWEYLGFSNVLRAAAMRFTSLSPSTTPVERMHKVHKINRTKARNLLRYSRALGLNFICCEMLMAQLQNDPVLDWKEVLKYKQRFLELSALDKSFLTTLLVENEAVAALVAEDEADGCITTPEALTHNDTMNPDVCAEEPDDKEAVNSVLVEIQQAQQELPKTSRGRIIKRKIFEGFFVTKW
jgi:hypothetical protein